MVALAHHSPRPRRSLLLIPAGLALFVVLLPILFLAVTPTSTETQGLLSLVAIIAVLLLKPFASGIAARFLMLAIASGIVLRYWSWRVTETVPPVGLDPSFAAASVLLLIETYAIAVFFLNALISSDPIEAPDPVPVDPADLPTVDILIPSYNEPVDMLAITLAAAKHIYYPPEKRRVVLCDDGGTDQRCNSSDPELAARSRKRRAELQALCKQLGAIYSTRERNEHAKAGNMSAALERLDGELVVVFDADHVPSRDFLARTVGFFVKKPDLFLVQTPHFFINADPVQRNLALHPRCPPENEMFYGKIHKGLDRWGGAFFCGSAAVLRRSALDEVGGFAGETITEDAETALDIHARGWRSIYLDRAMIAGLQPETFSSFIQQRGRWATGMMQMLLLKNPLFRPGLNPIVRLCYLNSMSFWFFPLVRIAFLLIPLVYLFFGIEIFVASLSEVVAYTLGYVLILFAIQNALYSHVRWPLISEVYEIAQAPYLAKALFATVLRPRSATFSVTSKDETLEEDRISDIAFPLFALTALTALGVVALGVRWWLFPGDREVLIIVGGWAVFNFLLTALALRAVFEKRQRRSTPRVRISVPARVAGHSFEGDGTLVDASMGGVRLQVMPRSRGHDGHAVAPKPASIEIGETVHVTPIFAEAPDLQVPIACLVRSVTPHDGGFEFGLSFRPEQERGVREAVAYLVFGNSEPWAERRAAISRKGLLAGLFYVFRMALVSIPLTMIELLQEPSRRRRQRLKAGNKLPPAHLLAFGADFEEPRIDDVAPKVDQTGLDLINSNSAREAAQ
ncbi:MAG: UDP-forming cellulose synthase catalytic subunit [Pararhodobacter sp.]|nr:UDP-forming cellulose synthase catalytic subunit [Pararhodobacter sp.]